MRNRYNASLYNSGIEFERALWVSHMMLLLELRYKNVTLVKCHTYGSYIQARPVTHKVGKKLDYKLVKCSTPRKECPSFDTCRA